MDISWYYQRELEQLRHLSKEFSREHPAIAPLLAGPSSDPDVERLLEGCAYITAQLTQKLEESYDQIAENLTSLLLPQLLQSIPSCTMMNFAPKAALQAKQTIPPNSRIGSAEINNVSCIFSTTYPVEIAPVMLADVFSETKPGRPFLLRIEIAQTKNKGFHQLNRLRLHLTGPHANATHRLYALLFYLDDITLTLGKTPIRLPKNALQIVGFDPKEALFPYPDTAWSGYRLLQEYYIFPEKFCFLDMDLPIENIPYQDTDRLSIEFHFKEPIPKNFPSFSKTDFALFATPAINVFPFETTPIKLDFKAESYAIRANTNQAAHYTPYKVEKVTAINTNGQERIYTPILTTRHEENQPHYTLLYPKNSKGQRQMRLFPMYSPKGGVPNPETLSLEVLYTNGNLPSKLNSGEITLPLSTSPALATFTNLTPPTASTPPPIDGETFWALLAHLHLNYLPLADTQTLKALLLTYLPAQNDSMQVNANKRRIDAIEELLVTETDFVWKGRPVKGSNITITLDQSGFSNIGDMSLFGMVLAKFIHQYCAINSFINVTVRDTFNQTAFQWNNHQTKPSLL